MTHYRSEWIENYPNGYQTITTFEDGSKASAVMHLLEENPMWEVEVYPKVGASYIYDYRLTHLELSHFLDRMAKQIALEDVIKNAGYDEDRIAEAILNAFEVSFK